MKKSLWCVALCSVVFGYGCSDDSTVAPPLDVGAECGNGEVEVGEICDDGNAESGDGCTSTCTAVEEGYRCPTPGVACVRYDVSSCGDGVLNDGEACDDGNAESGDGCTADCSRVEEGFTCDTPGSACTPISEEKPLCGNGALDDGEACDDGNAESGDGCAADCSRVEEGYRCPSPGTACILMSCGNGIVDPGEQCDEGEWNVEYGAFSGMCSIWCDTAHYCGDGLWDDIDRAHGEACDDGGDTSDQYDGCTAQCTRTGVKYCGDSLRTHDELCDDGNAVSGDGCSDTCQIEPGFYCPELGKPCIAIENPNKNCGNGELDDGETCDDGNTDSGDGCSVACQIESGYICPEGRDCRKTVCGDGIIEGMESCEDGNTDSGDGCSSSCQLESGWVCDDARCYARACGDGIVAGDETCDDGNTTSGDGCNMYCQRESGYACPESGGACHLSVCGDGIVEGDETCDEGENKTAGCIACVIQPGWECLIANTACTQTAVCGNGKLEGAETCDEGEHKTPGCSDLCVAQPGYRCPTPGEACIKGTCGDGSLDVGEECDDGNMLAGDGCDPFCKRESIFQCNVSGECHPICGDGITVWEAGEECDDGNRVSGDGCSSICTIEDGFVCTKYSNDYPDTVQLPVTYRDFRGYSSNTCTSMSGPVDGCIDDSIRATYGNNFVARHGHPDFENVNANEKNIVKAQLGADGLPEFNKAPNTRITAASFQMWYRDFPGINKTFKEHLTLKLADASQGRYYFDSTAFFPLTGRGYGNFQGYSNNFHFTSHIQTYFKYNGKSAQLDFRGDDDVWVFVNGVRAIDLGGCHSAESASFTIQAKDNAETGKKYDPTFHLYEGGIYPISFFHAERHTGASNFRLTMTGFVNMGTSSCAAICGDGLVRGDEECDLGLPEEEAAKQGCVQCKKVPVCGNGIIEGTEQCDTAESWCSNCMLANGSCGNGVVDEHEQCDLGAQNGLPGEPCLINCRLAGCGNAIVEDGEECDDGPEGSDNCSSSCKKPYCGDGIVQGWLGEVCDDGVNDGAYGGCGLGCSYFVPRCGDAVVDAMNGETCDDGINSGAYGTCTSDCQKAPHCGDGILQPEYEQCDDGELNGTEGTMCSNYCKYVVN